MIDLSIKVKKRAVSKDAKRGWGEIRVGDACLSSKVEMKRGEMGWQGEEKKRFLHFTVRVVLLTHCPLW